MYSGGKEVALVRMHLHLQDVNTAENVVSQELNLDISIKDIESSSLKEQTILEKIADESVAYFVTSIRPLQILSISGEQIMVNHGQVAGLQVGDVLSVESNGEMRIDPYTGVVMQGVSGHQLGLIKITNFSAQGWAVAKRLESSADFKEGLSLTKSDHKKKTVTESNTQEEDMLQPSW